MEGAVAKRRIRKGRFRWGEGFVEGRTPFSGPRLRSLREHCYDLIGEFPHGPEPGADGITARIPIERHQYGFVLWYDYDARIWVLDIAARPVLKRRKRVLPR